MTDEVRQLVAGCLAGQQSAMRALVDQFHARVYALCYRLLGHRQDAEDVAQESFARAFHSLRHWDAQREFAPWLLAIAGNRCRTHLAARRRRPTPLELVEQVADPAPAEDAARHLAEEVALALGGLRAEYRRAFLLFHQRQLSYAEIAEELHVPLGTVKTWVHRARLQLIDVLRERGAVEAHDAMPRV